jgi:hypothetical protein
MANRHNITFNTTAEYNTFKASANYVEPNVSYIKETNGVQYNKYDPYNGHAYVDLGLPSGTKWATMNVGATGVTDYGNYYKYGLGASQYDNAQTDYSGEEDPLAASADTATQVWGGEWHMPTQTQFEELTANTTYEWTTIDGINGGKFTAQNGNYVFFPAAGYYTNGSLQSVSYECDCWCSTPLEQYAYMWFLGDGSGVVQGDRDMGQSIRPVFG